jgi:hypothetical protein
MFGQATYLLWLLIFVALPLAFLWLRWPGAIWAQRRALGWTTTYMPIEDLFGVAVISSAAACAVLVFGYSPRRWI